MGGDCAPFESDDPLEEEDVEGEDERDEGIDYLLQQPIRDQRLHDPIQVGDSCHRVARVNFN